MSAEKKSSSNVSSFPNATDIIKAVQSRELFFAVVGHVGSGISEVAGILKNVLKEQDYDVEIIKASSAIKDWSLANEHHVPDESGRASIDSTCTYQDLGDRMREHTQDYSAVVQGMMKNVRILRAEKTGVRLEEGVPIEPDNNKRAYIFDSIRHPAEVYLLRTVYSDSFSLIGVVCQEDIRTERLLDKFYEHKDKSKGNSKIEVNKLMERDADDKTKDHGQHVADAFFESDYFVDNTVDSMRNKENWQMHEMMGRLIDIMTHARIVRPTVPEKAMHFAMTAQISSSCLSRQVGAAIVDESGDIVATGTNEVPKAGGGVYGKVFSIEDDNCDDRCFLSDNKVCSSNVEQNKLAERLSDSIRGKAGDEVDTISILRKAGLKDLLEFSRAVHAEMDAITSAARTGKPLTGSKMYVTTFPCHYCARHIVASGIYEVQYIEPYPKSLAMSLHKDAITSEEIDWVPPGKVDQDKKGNSNYQKVLFKPFVGVSPRLYARAFTKDRPLKDYNTGEMKIGMPLWGNKWNIKKVSYMQLEADLTKESSHER